MSLLKTGMTSFEQAIFGKLLTELEQSFAEYCQKHTKQSNAVALIAYLKHVLTENLAELSGLRNNLLEFNGFIIHAATPDERAEHILTFAQRLGANGRELKEDRKALKRWFGPETIQDRFAIRTAAIERLITFQLERLGAVSAVCLAESNDRKKTSQQLWTQLALEELIVPLLAYDGDARVARAAFASLSRVLQALPENMREQAVAAPTLQFIYRAALQRSLDVWIQGEALSLLAHLSKESFSTVVSERVTEPAEGDDFIVRAQAVELIGRHSEQIEDIERLIESIAQDPSPFVRQKIPFAVKQLEVSTQLRWLKQLASTDKDRTVRAAMLIAPLKREDCSISLSDTANFLCEVLKSELDSFVLRTACFAAEECVRKAEQPLVCGQIIDKLQPAVLELRQRHDDAAVRRYASQAYEFIWSEENEEALRLKAVLKKPLANLVRGKSIRISYRDCEKSSEACLGRVLAVLGQDDFGYDVERGIFGYRITRGAQRGFRLWRLIHELIRPAPDKRQPFNHATGRIFYGELQAPSTLMAELTQTRVPGEPLYLQDEQSWRPYLPLLDIVVSSFNRSLFSHKTRIFTAEGVTDVTVPGFLRGLGNYLKLVCNFSKIAKKRNWKSSDTSAAPNEYVRELERFGVDVSFQPHQNGNKRSLPRDESVDRFFQLAPLSAFSVPDELWGAFSEYFVSLHQNSVTHLTVFSLAVAAVFLWDQSKKYRSLKHARKQIPVVIGGWGTRGKSGTERIKSALFNAVGAGIVSKTTGCEAMLVQAYPFDRSYELPLFRPYDKATIWEQRDAVCLGEKFSPEIFLWECMALNPRYVTILQRSWMGDDVTTITNAYPDHEDIQGPSGLDVAETISTFVPEKGVVLTSEELMLPLIRDQAKAAQSELRTVGWLEAGLLTEDILARFPYNEHPYNIALVVSMAEHFGLDRTFTLKEIADRVVPDLGVLKRFPESVVRGRTLQFTNAMSANERYGCLNSWTRMGFSEHNRNDNPAEWIVTLVNNRADRLPRSRVFAKMLVRDLNADKHVLIGDNLKALQDFIEEEWAAYVAEIQLWQGEGQDNQRALELFDTEAKRLRVPMDEDSIVANLSQMLARIAPKTETTQIAAIWQTPEKLSVELENCGLAENAEDIVAFVEAERSHFQRFASLRQRVATSSTGEQAEIASAVGEYFTDVFKKKIVVIEDYNTSGETLIGHLAELAPPGVWCNVVGVQNIKGTGLDFVYSWLDWERCFRLLDIVDGDRKAEIRRALLELSSIYEFGLLSEVRLRKMLEQIRHSRLAQDKELQVALDLIQNNLERSITKISADETENSATSTHDWSTKARTFVAYGFAECLDVAKGIERRYRSYRIFKDLGAQRIGREQAKRELWKLYREQK